MEADGIKRGTLIKLPEWARSREGGDVTFLLLFFFYLVTFSHLAFLSLSRFRQSTAFLLFFPPPRHSIPIFRAIQTKTARAEFLPFVPSRVKVGAPHHPRLLSARPFFHHTQNCREREREREKRCFSSSIHPSIHRAYIIKCDGGRPCQKPVFFNVNVSLSLWLLLDNGA